MVRVALAIVLAVLLLLAPAATAAERIEILRDCQDGSLSGTYTPAEIRDARDNIPADIDQYSDCRDVLSRALIPASSGGRRRRRRVADRAAAPAARAARAAPPARSPPAARASAAARPRRRSRRAARRSRRRSPRRRARAATSACPARRGPIVPGASGLGADAARHTLPGSLFLTLVLLAVAAVAASAPVVRRRVLDRRPA